MMRKYKAVKNFSALIAAALAMLAGACAFASTLVENNGSLYSLVLEKQANFEDGVYSGFDNGIGTILIDTIDDEHGKSVILGADSSVNTAIEGSWMQLNGDETKSISIYEFDMYIEKLEQGNLRFFQRGVQPSIYMTTISKDGINNGVETKPFEFGVWHKIRFLYDCVSHSYSIYVDDMETALFSGAFNEKFDSVQYMRITLWAADASVAVDNFQYYSLVKMIDGYETPRLNLVPAEEQITESEAAHIEAKIETKAEIDNVKFYVNDELVYTDNEAPYILEQLFDKGSHTIRAEATDIYGESGENAIDITVLADTKPRIVFGLKDGGTYDKTALQSVPVSITMTDAELVEGTVLADGAKIATLSFGSNTVNLSALSIGRHNVTVYAENDQGEYAEMSVQITVEKLFDDVIWSMDFNDGSTLGHLNGNGQFIRLETLREDFKDSLLVGANTTQDVNLEGAWIPFDFKNTTTTASADFDLYFSDINGNGMTVMLNLSASYRPVLFKFTTNGIVDADETRVGTFETNRWYHVTLTIDAQNTSYTLYVDDKELIANHPIKNMERGMPMDSIRLVSKLQGTQETYFAVDNAVVRQITQAPSIINITSSRGGENIVSARDREISVYFSGALQATSVYPAKFTIGDAVIEKATYDAENYCVTLVLEKPLSAGSYRLAVAENLVMGNGEIYAEKLYGDFAVCGSMLETISAAVSGAMLNAEIMNHAEEAQTVYAIFNLYNGNALKTSTAKAIMLIPGENFVVETVPEYISGNKVEVFMWDYLNAPTCFMNVTN